MLFCDVFRKTVEPLSGSGRLISGEYDNITKPCAVQAILESLMAQDMSDGTHQHTFPLLNIQHSTFHRHSSVPVTADQSTMHTTQGDVKAHLLQEKKFWTFATFPTFQHSGFYFPPAAGWSPSLSREGNVLHDFLFLAFYSYVFVKWKKCNILPSFLLIHIVDSTFHHQPAKTGLSIVWKSKIS